MVEILGIASHEGVATCSAHEGPRLLHGSAMFRQRLDAAGIYPHWGPLLAAEPCLQPDERAARLFASIRHRVAHYAATGQPFVALGGDHASAMGVWSGTASRVLHGLVWIDAHLDAHNYDTTSTGNLHGMPVAALLGARDEKLQRIYGSTISLDPERVIILGVRSAEEEEWSLMEQLGIRVYTMEDIRILGGFAAALEEAIAQAGPRGEAFGVSIDLDAVDPADAPAVCTRVGGGISGHDLTTALSILNGDNRLLGLEIAEFSPRRDRDQRTEKLIAGMIAAVYGAERSP
ncbi:MAG: arginase family protein [Pseudomonadota bacterium]